MSEASRDPHHVQSELEATEENQAPPRQREQDGDGEQPPTGTGDHVDLSLLEAHQGRGTSGMWVRLQAHPPVSVAQIRPAIRS